MVQRLLMLLIALASLTAASMVAGSGSGRGCCSRTHCPHEEAAESSCEHGTCLKEHCRTCNGDSE